MRNRIIISAALIAAHTAGLAGAAPGVSGNMIGRQSQNEGILVVPAPPKVAVDGRLDEWDLSGRIWIFADKAVRRRYSAEVAAMWDKAHLYLAAKWKDPTPMYSTIDPDFNVNDGWKSDSWQMRILTDRPLWITTWCFTPKKLPVMHVAYWKDPRNARAGQDAVVYRAAPGGTDLGGGVEMAYRKDADGKGFVQEIKVPWKVLYRKAPEIAAGLVFRLGNELLWGDPTGKTWPVHRYADNMQPGHTSREFYWTAQRAWGDARLVAKGSVPVRQYVDETARLPGTVPVRLELPKSAARFTVLVEDAAGRRVRNLAGDFDPEDYRVGEAGGRRTVEVKWDCLDDQGRLVEPGEYRTRGLTHEGLAAEYEMCFYNPGVPPWRVAAGSGAWGADHGAPLRVARAGDWVIVSWPFAEGGSGIMGIGPDGRKRWGEKRGGQFIAADKDYVYAVPAGWHLKKEVLCRLARKDGSYRPFQLDGKPRPFELPTSEVFGNAAAGSVQALAAGAGKLALALSEGKIALLDAASAKLLKLIDTPAATGLAFGRAGRLYALWGDKLHAVNTATGKTTVIPTPGLGKPSAVAVDNDENVVVADVGPDSQVKAYSPAGKLVYTCGRKGGRPLRGKFDPQGMVRMSSVAVDAAGHVWVVESWNYPRRVSVWGRDGKLVRDYLGNTGYAGTGCYLHDGDPSLAYCGPIELALDRAAGTWRITKVLWVPDSEAGECFGIQTGSAVHPQRFSSKVSGKLREYLYAHDPRDGGGNVVYMSRGGKWQPVAAVCLVGHVSGRFDRDGSIAELPAGEFADLNAKDGLFWHDRNKDGRVQRTECEIVPAPKPGELKTDGRYKRGEAALSLRNGWGGRIGSDLVFYADGLIRYRPVGFSDDGAPIYRAKGMERFGPAERGDLVPVPAEDLLLCLSFKGYADRTTGMLGIDTRTGDVRWSYPNRYPGVHGSHRAPMPAPGLLIGPLKICGVAEIGKGIGRVLLLRGNLGQDFFMTTDGFYVGALFQDGRLPGESLPNTEAALKGMPMEAFSHGSEPFNGWFGRQADGKVRETCGFAREAAMILEIKGLETIRRFAGPKVKLDRPTILKANEANGARALAAAKPKRYTVKKLGGVTVDGDAREWRALPSMPIHRGGGQARTSARLARDDENLYLLFDVRDPSPWQNEGKDATRLFKTGDAVDLQLATRPGGKKRRDPAAGDVRVVLSQLAGKPVAVLMRPIDPAADKARRVRYHSPVTDKTFDRVEVLADARVKVKTHTGRYVLEAALPLKALGLEPKAGLVLRGDVGVISSDAAGKINTARTYWSNPHTNLVSDLPHEAWLYPAAWGEMEFE